MIQKDRLYNFFIIAARLWLAYILIDYGWAKLTGNQFGVTTQELDTPLKDLSLFRLSWYLADHEPFKSFIGISQLVAGGLLIFRRTCILGAFVAIPIWLNILMWDITFMGLASPFTFRIIYYLILTGLILLHYKHYTAEAIRSCLPRKNKTYQYPFWSYLLLPVIGFAIELLPFLIRFFIQAVK